MQLIHLLGDIGGVGHVLDGLIRVLWDVNLIAFKRSQASIQVGLHLVRLGRAELGVRLVSLRHVLLRKHGLLRVLQVWLVCGLVVLLTCGWDIMLLVVVVKASGAIVLIFHEILLLAAWQRALIQLN